MAAGTHAQQIVIREMELIDLAAVYALGDQLFTSELWPALYRTWDEHELALMFTSDTETCLVAEMGDRIVGFVLGTIIDKSGSAWSYGYIVWIGVEPGLGRRGVGRRLVDKVTQRFSEMGVRMLMVDTAADNEAAVAFFEKQGFGNSTEHVYLTKNISASDAAKRKPKARKPAARKPKKPARKR